ncbi:hypothetical protein [Chryseolinea sp. H1M3-3]|uniref:hypothetical protein n=1 Tax=Chryseolinea sp. H1M3-3 TaxID=3034144 RepID=UPI0023ED2FB3|nr:hypothetical protein [Chryseolinea sp. H1M3-3]
MNQQFYVILVTIIIYFMAWKRFFADFEVESLLSTADAATFVCEVVNSQTEL